MTSVLLLSGGLDSTAVAAWLRPDHCLHVDYGQRPAPGEWRAAQAVAAALELTIDQITLGSVPAAGLMSGETPQPGRSQEWWPFRNQLLITVAAAYAVTRGATSVMIGTVAGDGAVHTDGTPTFLDAISRLVALQEGAVTVTAPAIALTTRDVIAQSGLNESIARWSHSCHRSEFACGSCPGCRNREHVLDAVFGSS